MKKNYLFISLLIIFLLFLSACTKLSSDKSSRSVPKSLIDRSDQIEDEEDSQSLNENFVLDEFEVELTPDHIKEGEGESLSNNNIVPSPQNYVDFYSTGYRQALIKTNLGDIKVLLYGDDSLNTVNNFLNLASIGFYEGIKFHRVIANFMIQAGCPNTKTDQEFTYGTGGPGYLFPDEFNNRPLVRGSLAMANAGPDTNGSQFFIVTANSTAYLDGLHTNFGEVIEGMAVVDAIESVDTNVRDLPLEDIIIESIEILKSN